MLPKKYRLPLRTEWHRVREKGRTFQSPLFGLVVLRQIRQAPSSAKATEGKQDELEKEGKEGREGKEGSRFAFIVSKKISKKAVVRNRVRRHLAEAVKKLLPQIKGGYEAVFLAKKAMVGRRFEEVLEEAERVLKEAGILGR